MDIDNAVEKIRERLKQTEKLDYLSVDIDNLSIEAIAEIGLASTMGLKISAY